MITSCRTTKILLGCGNYISLHIFTLTRYVDSSSNLSLNLTAPPEYITVCTPISTSQLLPSWTFHTPVTTDQPCPMPTYVTVFLHHRNYRGHKLVLNQNLNFTQMCVGIFVVSFSLWQLTTTFWRNISTAMHCSFWIIVETAVQK